jgi:glycosyl transferase, family 25
MRFAEFFDRTYILNLPERTDRRDAVCQELAKINMPLQVGKVELFAAIRPDRAAPFIRLGSKGCFLSTLAMLRRARNEGLRNLMIVQDDLILSKNFERYEERLIDRLRQTNWDVVQFGYCPELPGQPRPEEVATYRPFDGEVIGAHFFAVNHKAFDPLIGFLEGLLGRPQGHPDGGPMPIDGAINCFKWHHPETVRLVSVPTFGGQRSSRSDISPRWFDQLPMLAAVAGFARQALVPRPGLAPQPLPRPVPRPVPGGLTGASSPPASLIRAIEPQ